MATSPDVSCKAGRRQATNGTSDVPRCKGRPWVYRHTAGRLFMGNESDGGSIPSKLRPCYSHRAGAPLLRIHHPS